MGGGVGGVWGVGLGVWEGVWGVCRGCVWGVCVLCVYCGGGALMRLLPVDSQ